MKAPLKRVAGFLFSPASAPLLLLVVSVLAYGLLIPKLGFYWDDLPMSWIRYQLGPQAMARYFSTNRPIWGLLYQLTTRLLPHEPLYWQSFALFWRWMSAVIVWAIVRQLWPRQAWMALGASLLFLLYPGFNQQWVSYLYSHFFIVLTFFLFSILCMLWSLQSPCRFWPLTLLGMLFSMANLWMMEYFFLLEILRPVILWIALRERVPEIKFRSSRAFRVWLPYLVVFFAAIIWRMFIFKNQVYDYELLPRLKEQPIATALYLVKMILVSLWTVSIPAWAQIFSLPIPAEQGLLTTLGYIAIVLLSLIVLIVYLLKSPRDDGQERADMQKTALSAIFLGMISLFMAGWVFWLIDFPPGLAFPLNRFTLPFILGVSLVLAGLLQLIPHHNIRLILLAVILSLAVGRHFLWANDYRRDWNTQKVLFWQMYWRMPALKADTLVLVNEGALKYYADNSLAAVLNWIYAPGNHSEHIDYMLFYPNSRLGGGLPGLEKGLPVYHNFLAGSFHGSTSQVVVVYFSPPGCLRVLDPVLDGDNHLIPELMRQAASLSLTDPILMDEAAHMPQVYGAEPPHRWCYYFEKAELARQREDWQEVAVLGNQAFMLDDHPNDPVERFVFVEGYAHTGDWERAHQLSLDSFHVSPSYIGPSICNLWERIASTTPDSLEKQAAVESMLREFNCLP